MWLRSERLSSERIEVVSVVFAFQVEKSAELRRRLGDAGFDRPRTRIDRCLEEAHANAIPSADQRFARGFEPLVVAAEEEARLVLSRDGQLGDTTKDRVISVERRSAVGVGPFDAEPLDELLQARQARERLRFVLERGGDERVARSIRRALQRRGRIVRGEGDEGGEVAKLVFPEL